MTSINIANKTGSYILIITSFLKQGEWYSRSDKAFLYYYVYFTTTINFETLHDFNCIIGQKILSHILGMES